MYYYKKNNDRIEKYSVQFCENSLKDLRIRIINRCSEITHMEYDEIEAPNYFDYLKIRNYSQTKTGRTKYGDFYSMDKNIYHFSYNHYEFPYLITLIDNLLAGDSFALHEILNPDYAKEKAPFSERIEKLEKEINSIPNQNYTEKAGKLEELKDLFETAKLNANQEDVRMYYDIVKDEFLLKLVDVVDVSDVKKVMTFFNISKDDIKISDNNILSVL